MSKTAVVITHFGTTHPDTIRKSLDPFVKDAETEFAGCDVFEAYSSKFIRSALERKHGIVKKSLEEVLGELAGEKYGEVYVQPTVLMMGLEYDKLTRTVHEFEGSFEKICLGKPLINDREDYQTLMSALDMEYDIRFNPRDVFVFMGHGANHPGEAIYAALDYRFKHEGYRNAFVATVEGYPSLDTVLPEVIAFDPEVVYIVPLMIVAGDHAKNDMAGDDDESWKSRLEAKGFEVIPIVKGLGEIPVIRKMILGHVRDCMK